MNLTFQYKILIALAMICLISACAKEFDEEMLDVPEVEVPVVEQVEMDLLVMVHSSVADIASCRIGGNNYVFDSSGTLCIDDILIDVKGEWIVVSAPGYSSVVKLIMPRLESRSTIWVDLEPLKEMAQFNASDGVIVEDEAALIEVPKDAFVDENGILYNGLVHFRMSLTRAFYYSKLRAFSMIYHNRNNSNEIVAPRGMCDLKFIDDSGNILSLRDGVEVKVEINNIFGPKDSLETFHFAIDELKWSSLGFAQKKNEWIVKDIDRMGLIVFGESRKSTIVEFQVEDQQGQPIINETTVCFDVNNSSPYVVNIDNDGYVKAPFSTGDDLYLLVFNYCNIQNFEYKKLPLINLQNSVASLEPVRSDSVRYKKVIGRLFSCDSIPLKNHLIREKGWGRFYDVVYSDNHGRFEKLVRLCSNNVEFDFGGCISAQQVLKFDINDDGVTDLGDIYVCP